MENEQPCLVQEFIDGSNLEQELAVDGKFSQHQVRELLTSLLPVLDFLHNQPIPVIHRDIKPANIIRRHSTRELVLVDFGAAKLASHTMLAKTGTSIGSAEYVSVEQSRGKPTFSSDIYSLGVTCIHLLTNTHPFDLYSPNTENGWAWRDYLGDSTVDEHLADILDKMIAQSVNQRYRSAENVMGELKKVAAISSSPPTDSKISFPLAQAFRYPRYLWLVPTISLAVYLGQIGNALRLLQPLNSYQVNSRDILAVSWMDNSINTVKSSNEALEEQNRDIEKFADKTLTGLLNWKVGSGSYLKKPSQYLDFGEGKDISVMLDNAPPSIWRNLLSVHPDMRRQTLLIIAKAYKDGGVTTGNEMRWVKNSIKATRNNQDYWDIDIKGIIEVIDKNGVKQAAIPFNKKTVVTKSGAARPSSPLFLLW
jgi:serine/threonine protein kinase